MSYLVFCTFDLKGASSTDYQNAYADLAAIGLKKVHKSDNGNDIVVPTTAAMGEFNGSSAASVRADIMARVRTAFSKRGFTSEIFIVVGGIDWAWEAHVT